MLIQESLAGIMKLLFTVKEESVILVQKKRF